MAHQPPSTTGPTNPDPEADRGRPLQAMALLTTISPPPKKIPPVPWSHLETVHLIESYQQKWYSLKRGQLKASQWEEVAVAVAARCGYDEPSKTATQCRHKMEKLRKRYRSEKQRPTTPSSAAWPYFDLMDLMERGPFPISARPIPSFPPRFSRSSPSSSSSSGNGDDNQRNKSRSINRILRKRPAPVTVVESTKKSSDGQWNSGGVSRGLRDSMMSKKRGREDVKEEEEEEEGGEVELLSELAAVVRSFGEGFVRIENMKMEMMRETERSRMEMETKRMEMILDSQSRIVDMVAKAVGCCPQRKVKKSHDT